MAHGLQNRLPKHSSMRRSRFSSTLPIRGCSAFKTTTKTLTCCKSLMMRTTLANLAASQSPSPTPGGSSSTNSSSAARPNHRARWHVASRVTARAESPTWKMGFCSCSPAKAEASKLFPTPTESYWPQKHNHWHPLRGEGWVAMGALR